MYLTSYDSLRRALDSRLPRREEAQAGVRRFLRSEYGMERGLVIPPHAASSEPAAVLARQIGSVSAEDIAFVIGSRKLGLMPLTATFTRDAFDPRNHDKAARVKIPWVEYSRNGTQRLAREQISAETAAQLAGVPLANIRCLNGKMLPGYHRALRDATRLNGHVIDVSQTHSLALADASRKPPYVYRCATGHLAEQRVYLNGDEVRENDRPPSGWYYPYYLSWFVDGSLVLFETYDNPLAEVAEAKRLFEACVRKVSEGTGFEPLIVKIPPLSNDMLYCNRHLLWNNHGIPSIEAAAEKLPMEDTVTFFRSIAELAIGYH